MKSILSLCFIWFAAFNRASAQVEATNFNKIVPLIHLNESTDTVYKRLDSLKQARTSSSISRIFDRDIDFGLNHIRIDLGLNNIPFQIDILSVNNRVCLYDVRALDEYDRTLNKKYFKKVEIDSALISDYLKLRNNFYRSHKNTKDLLNDIEYNKSYAMYCGDGSPETKKGKNIDKLVKEKRTKMLEEMLQSISCETQAYGITGFERLIKQGYQPDSLVLRIMDHIEKRNSPVLTCGGCIDGVLVKPYNGK